MDSLFIVGTDTVVGANLAAHWTQAGRSVTGVRLADESSTDDAFAGSTTRLQEARRALAAADPDRVIYCGAAADSAWTAPPVGPADEQSLRSWARAVREAGRPLTYLSSDAVFSGPWLFHAETDLHHCLSPEAGRLRSLEELVQRVMPDALIVRTHAFGWSPLGENGPLERLLTALERGMAVMDAVPHATPILGTDLGDYLDRSHDEGVSGILHVAGAERVNRGEFARRLAAQFGLAQPSSDIRQTLSEPARGFGHGETALQTRKAKGLLNLGMPMLDDGLARLQAQRLTGFLDRVSQHGGVLEFAA